MFTLRIYTGEKKDLETNIMLGSQYSVVRRSQQPELFHGYSDEVYAFIVYEAGLEYPLLSCNRNFIMNENGGLYCNIKER